MRELLASRPATSGPFKPEEDNASRPEAPVPVLLLNATSLNTGHNWRFEAVAMGEPLRASEWWVEIDKNTRYARTHYTDMTPKQADFPLGHAVAASACVPALFHPLAVSDLFEGKRVQLVDGGVHDNQGVCGLYDTDCKELIVSDASGQLSDLDKPGTRMAASAGRATRGIYGDRVREEQLSDSWRNYDSLIVHLRRGLAAPTVYPHPATGPTPEPTAAGQRRYGDIDPKAAGLIARTRTDLDAFSEIEAYSLGAWGYAMTGDELAQKGHAADAAQGSWEFQRLAEPLKQPSEELIAQLETARKLFFKSWRTSWATKVVGIVLALIGLAVMVALVCGLMQLSARLLVLLGVAALVVIGLYLEKIPVPTRYSDPVFTRLNPVLLAPFLWLGSKITLALTPAFLKAGRAERIEPAP